MSLGNPFTDARVYGTALLVFINIVALFGMGPVSKTSMLFFSAVIIAILSALIGLFASNRAGMIPYGLSVI